MDNSIPEGMRHIHRMRTDPEYAAMVNFQKETANQGLEDMSLEMLGMASGLGALLPKRSAVYTAKELAMLGGKSGANLIKQQQLLRAGEQAKTAKQFADQAVTHDLLVKYGEQLAKEKGLGRLSNMKEFAAQDALRAQNINNGVTSRSFKQEMRDLGMNPE